MPAGTLRKCVCGKLFVQDDPHCPTCGSIAPEQNPGWLFVQAGLLFVLAGGLLLVAAALIGILPLFMAF